LVKAKIASRTTPAITKNKTLLELFFAGAAGADGFAGAGVLVTEAVLRDGTGGITIFAASTFALALFLAATFLVAGFLAAAFLIGRFADFFTALLAVFLTAFLPDLLATFLAGRFAAAFLTGRFAEAFFFAATTTPST
jgi:hypothetical protein